MKIYGRLKKKEIESLLNTEKSIVNSIHGMYYNMIVNNVFSFGRYKKKEAKCKLNIN